MLELHSFDNRTDKPDEQASARGRGHTGGHWTIPYLIVCSQYVIHVYTEKYMYRCIFIYV